MYNFENLLELIKRAKGSDEERSMRQYALDANMNPATLNLIVNNKRKANMTHLVKLTSVKAMPRGGVTLKDMSIAAGYESMIPSFDENYVDFDVQTKLEVISTGLIQKIISEKYPCAHIDISNKKEFDIAVSLADKCWHFEIKSFARTIDEKIAARSKQILSELFFKRVSENDTVTIIVDSELAFNELSKYACSLLYKGNLSVVYLDAENMCFVKETFISFFNDEKKNGMSLFE